MATTPPPRQVIEVPGAPRYGSGFDLYGRFSPRRSERLATQHPSSRKRCPSPGPPELQPVRSFVYGNSRQHGQHDDSETSSASNPAQQRQQNGLTCSMNAETSHTSPSRRVKKKKLFPSSTTLASPTKSASPPPSHFPMDSVEPKPKTNAAMLPTPIKTPTKKETQNVNLEPRALFGGRSHTKPKKYSQFSLESFNSELERQEQAPLEVFTDSRDRIPQLNPSMDNPFLSKATDSTQDSAIVSRTRTSKRNAKVDKDVRRDDGLLYVFRGRKTFRKFKPDSEEEDDPTDLGLLASRPELLDGPLPQVAPLTRSSIKPRVLFPSAAQSAAQSAAAAARKADNDIDDNEDSDQGGVRLDSDTRAETPTPSTAKGTLSSDQPPVTPPSRILKAATPSSPLASGRSLRSQMRKDETAATATTPCRPDGLSSPKRPSPFDRWQRTKGSTPTKSRKRTAMAAATTTSERDIKKLRGQ